MKWQGRRQSKNIRTALPRSSSLHPLGTRTARKPQTKFMGKQAPKAMPKIIKAMKKNGR